MIQLQRDSAVNERESALAAAVASAAGRDTALAERDALSLAAAEDDEARTPYTESAERKRQRSS